MIVRYGDKRAAAFAGDELVRTFSAFVRQASKRLDILDAATSLDDLRGLRGNLEALKGDRVGQYSIRINEQWRICFRWPRGAIGPQDVEIVDYH